MEYRVLGPLEVRAEGQPLVLPGGNQRNLLAVLLLHGGRVVPADRLIDILWGEALPKAPTTTLHGVVAALRRTLARGGSGAGPLVTQPPGYRIDVAPGEFDLATFDELVQTARRDMRQGAMAEAAERLRSALALWRGPPLGGVDADELVHVEIPRLEERRLATVEERVDAELALGCHAELVAEVQALVTAHPLRERLRSQLMVALYRAGRQADALQVYQDIREKLADELGLDPGAELQRLQQVVLTADPELDAPAAAAPAVAVSLAESPPAQLPADVADFTGRGQQVDAVCDILTGQREGTQPSAVAVVLIAGRAGVGKTVLAVHAAHQIQAEFPDGQLYVNLRGAEAQSLDPAEVLGRFLRALGVDPAAVPEDLEERAEVYRSRLASRRVLVVLDSAASEAQIRPLLPGSPSCAVLVTSRARLVRLEGVRLVDLEVFEPDQAVQMLARLVGTQKVEAEPQAGQEIVRLCGYLPLAVRVAGARLAARPHRGLAQLAGRLADQRVRLDELASGELEVRASVGLSYAGLGPEARRALRLLGLLESPDFVSWVAAALLDVPSSAAEELVDGLVDARLLDVVGRDAIGQTRYGFHDLIRVYARERAAAEEPEDERRAALERALGAYLHFVDQAAARMPAAVPRQEHGPATRCRLDTERTVALVSNPGMWFQTEQIALSTAVEQAASLGLHEVAWDLCAALVSGPLVLSSRFDDWWRTHQAALEATREAGDRRGEAITLCGLGLLRLEQTRLDEADQYLRPALRGLREADSALGEAAVLGYLGVVWRLLGRLSDAQAFLDHARTMFEEAHDRHATACVSMHLGSLFRDQGNHRKAVATLQSALDTFRAAGDRRGQARTLWSLGSVHQAQNQLDHAGELYRQMLEITSETGDPLGAAYAAQALATIHIRQGKAALAQPGLTDCLEEFRQLHDPYGEGLTLTALGELHHAEGRLDLSNEYLSSALGQWEDLQLPLWRARTLRDLGDLHQARGEPEDARSTWREALAVFQQLDAPEAADLATQLGYER